MLGVGLFKKDFYLAAVLSSAPIKFTGNARQLHGAKIAAGRGQRTKDSIGTTPAPTS
jgi:hypothetical protein